VPAVKHRVHHYEAAILEIVTRMGSASAQAIFHELRQHGNRVGLSTVYRTLQLLTAAGTVWALSFGDQTFYEAASSTIIDAFTCPSCSRTSRVLRAASQDAPGPPGFFVPDVPVVVSGLCASCFSVVAVHPEAD
jgi:Fur family ferric uptake transcriptional regulator